MLKSNWKALVKQKTDCERIAESFLVERNNNRRGFDVRIITIHSDE